MSFLHNLDPRWIENLYHRWRHNAQDVGADWQAFFAGFDLGETGGAAASTCLDPAFALKQSGVQSLIYRYRDLGHLLACTDPLNPCPISHPLLDLHNFGLSDDDLDKVFHTRRFIKPQASLREILELMRETYCHSVGVEFMHIQNPDERQWLKERMESTRNRPDFSAQEKREILEKLQQAGLFEEFLHRKFLGQKRFSLEGGETLIPLLHAIVTAANRLDIKDLVLGMTHRGRLNVLANIFCKPLETIFAEFQDNLEYAFVGEGDVKYHKGFSCDIAPLGQSELHLSLASNPSHLEAVDPVVEGKSRARQDYYGRRGDAVLPVLIHGDAAFAGQGIVAETLNLSQLQGYATGGTLHIVINNQIGFTTLAPEARSTCYATDVAKMLQIPVFHVHGEDPEAAVYAAHLAFEYRNRFAKDVVVELICYRRQGHNEGDEPSFTQPLMYEKIKERPPIHELYAQHLVDEGVFSSDDVEALAEGIVERLEKALEGRQAKPDGGFHGKWKDIQRAYEPADAVVTAVDAERLRRLSEELIQIPKGFALHPKIEKFIQRRYEAVMQGEDIDWANAEALAFATLLAEGHTVRLSGQDSRRGTFSQRHAAVFNMESGEAFIPLEKVAAEGAVFQCYNSMLSEAAVLGFEYGYAIESPYGLVIWEAQFGDFVNGAQVIIDQFIVSSGSKWDRMCGLVMFLPHGYEGQGSEHSSARIERFLQLCANDNIQVCYPSTPAQFFHLLRRQLKQPFRRPLVVFTPKSLLRHPACRSNLDALSSGRFFEVLADQSIDAAQAKKVLLCSGKIYFDLEERRRELEREDVAIIRLEQLYPLRTDLLAEALEPLCEVPDIAWVQEEPRNNGAWSYINGPLARILKRHPRYVGRAASAAPAVGSHRLFKKQQEELLDAAFGSDSSNHE
ncbi:2-oxoglutarate dehydrogenase E1 component [Geoalkalibacter ferrihydriticus]|uniref:oxoglutarate dehydrogenase (succinyl-transferring) n=2 Tax=Geoalkalibacter ferrihydriticus TaxID=392333 RepID=A0A0C2HGA3_9BACT|nr:2-oxoglutarate dehydrogenase E1 component [Geoalkalibacter ferrihydriticus]KIH75966.1 2-oxoglutarate dehydrogenase [Geoalkalibacter ferrihydriticus DSM 17813]SDM57529.1 2-oxoglutarate dehydrogenase E1 component [Geoalkalibacter ferrihydriticus]